MNEKLELLTPGSQWVTPRGRTVTALVITNTDMPDVFVEQQGQHVVARTDKGKIISIDLDTFLRKHDYFIVSPEYEFVMNRVISGEVYTLGDVEQEPSDIEGEDEFPEMSLADIDDEDPENDEGEAEEADLSPIAPVGVAFNYEGANAPLLTQDDLDQLLVSVSSEPIIDNTCRLAATRHVLMFRCDSEDIYKLLVAAFDPNASRRGNAYGGMGYETPIGYKVVVWDAFISASVSLGMDNARFLSISLLETQDYLGAQLGDELPEQEDVPAVEETEQERLARLASSLDEDDAEDVELNETTTSMGDPVEDVDSQPAEVEPAPAPAAQTAPATFGTVKPASAK